MKIDMSRFGKILLSRPAGREAFLSARAYTFPKDRQEPIELDFSDVDVLAPSWADEFMRGVMEVYGKARLHVIEGNNLSVKTTFETLRATSGD